MPAVILYEYETTRSAKCRWALLEAGIAYESRGNSYSIMGSAELKEVNPLGKLPAAVIGGKALFESSAIVTAVADLAPKRHLIAKPGTWERNLHYQWTSFAHSELETWAWTAVLNSRTLLLSKEQHVPEICPQMAFLFKRSAAVLDAELERSDYLIGNRFSVADIIVGYAANLGRRCGYLDEGLPNVLRYLQRLFQREHCTLFQE